MWEGHSSRCFLILVEDNTVKLCLSELHLLEQDFSQWRINFISADWTHSGFLLLTIEFYKSKKLQVSSSKIKI